LKILFETVPHAHEQKYVRYTVLHTCYMHLISLNSCNVTTPMTVRLAVCELRRCH